jgi:hypothetical protein
MKLCGLMDQIKEDTSKGSKTTFYLEEVMAPVLISPEERESIRRELTEHLEDLARDEMVKGAGHEKAEARAREIFGPAKKLARKLRNGSGYLNWLISTTMNFLFAAYLVVKAACNGDVPDPPFLNDPFLGILLSLIFLILYFQKVAGRYELYNDQLLVKSLFRNFVIQFADIKNIRFKKTRIFGISDAIVETGTKKYIVPKGFGFRVLLSNISFLNPDIDLSPAVRKYIEKKISADSAFARIIDFISIIIYLAAFSTILISVFYIFINKAFSGFIWVFWLCLFKHSKRRIPYVNAFSLSAWQLTPIYHYIFFT